LLAVVVASDEAPSRLEGIGRGVAVRLETHRIDLRLERVRLVRESGQRDVLPGLGNVERRLGAMHERGRGVRGDRREKGPEKEATTSECHTTSCKKEN